MTASLYTPFKKLLLDGDIDLLVDTIKVALIDEGVYTFSAAHQYYSSISSAVVGTPGTLDNKTTTGGVFDADDEVIASVTGNSIEAIAVYKDTGNSATSPLICYVNGLSLTPNGGNITVVWNASGIFAL